MTENLEKIMIDAIPDGMLLVNGQGNVVRANQALLRMTGYTHSDLVGQGLDRLLPAGMRGHHQGLMQRYLQNPVQRSMGQKGVDFFMQRSDGQSIPIDVSLSPCTWQGETCVIAFVRDLSALKSLEQRVSYQATHDSLTGLANRWQFVRKLNEELGRPLVQQRMVAVVMLDLDHFKSINDSYGHNTGDLLLVQVANRLRTVLRPSDVLARLGGDEFMVLLSSLDGPGCVHPIVERLLATFSRPFLQNSCEFKLSASAGITLAPADANDTETLMRFADLALHHAKEAGRNRHVLYSPEMSLSLHRRLRMYDRLLLALEAHALQLHYQPQVDLETGQVVAVEALLRWTDDELGFVPPDQFVALAETTGLIDALGDWVLEKACAQLAEWRAQGVSLRMAVNLTAQQFHHEFLVDKLQGLIRRHGLTPDMLELELTESSAMSNPEQACEIMKTLAQCGFQLAIDDFGTGYSSLSYLQMLPVDRVKIDRSFVSRLGASSDDERLVQGIISLIHSLRKEVVAEGIETLQQLRFLQEHRCNSYQGWYFARAMPAHEILALLSGDSTDTVQSGSSASAQALVAHAR